MKFMKIMDDTYIYATGYTSDDSRMNGNFCTEDEYNEIQAMLNNPPIEDGYCFKLKTDLTWEKVPIPTIDPEDNMDEEIDPDELEYILFN